MSWSEIKKAINTDISVPLNTLINNKYNSLNSAISTCNTNASNANTNATQAKNYASTAVTNSANAYTSIEQLHILGKNLKAMMVKALYSEKNTGSITGKGLLLYSFCTNSSASFDSDNTIITIDDTTFKYGSSDSVNAIIRYIVGLNVRHTPIQFNSSFSISARASSSNSYGNLWFYYILF